MKVNPLIGAGMAFALGSFLTPTQQIDDIREVLKLHMARKGRTTRPADPKKNKARKAQKQARMITKQKSK